MMIKEAAGVIWQTLRDVWDELYPLAIINLVWFLTAIVLLPVTTAGVYYATNRVAHGKTVHFSDFLEGVKKFWWRSLLWFLANIVLVSVIYFDLSTWPRILPGIWAALLGGLSLAMLVFWLGMQMYFWPLLVEQGGTRMLLAWRNSAYLLLANPFYAFFIAAFGMAFLALSVPVVILLIFVGMAMIGVLNNNAVLVLLEKFGIIKEARPKPM
jgi:hypothetical protein